MSLPPVIGRYRTRRVLGTGSFATVVLADDEALETPVALKVLAENWSLDPDVRERFVREARILRRIDSPRLIRVHDIGEFEHRPFFVMDYAPGGTLGERLRQRRADGGLPLSNEGALVLARELASCIGAAHSFGVVHRDVKPSNLLIRPAPGAPPDGARGLLGPDERLVLADFGLARDLAAGSVLSVGAGTHGYMAPEQGEVGQVVDERTDVFAGTVVLAAAMTGAAPARLTDGDRRGEALEALDSGIAAVLESGLAPDRERRPPSAAAWLALVEDALQHATERAPRPDAVVTLPRWLARLRRTAMLGRDESRAVFASAWSCVEDGERVAVAFGGEAGVGKSRLLAELGAEAAARGALVLAGRGDATVRAPYGLVVDALRSGMPAGRLAALVRDAGEHAGHLALVLPELASTVPVPPPDVHPDQSRAQLFEAIDRVLTLAAGGAPVVLVADDLHAADPSTLGVLRYLVRADRPEPLLVLGAYRSSEVGPDHPLAALYEDLHRHRLVVRSVLDGLPLAAVTELVAAHTGAVPTDAAVEALRVHTGGNPFFVEEILTSAAEQGRPIADAVDDVPEGVRDVVRSRLRQLSASARRALAVAAVVGNDVERAVVERVAPDSLGGLDEAIDHGFVQRSDGRLAFRHGLVRAALLQDLDRRERVALHWQVGEALEHLHVADPESHLAEIAYHLERGAPAGDADKASIYLERAGEADFRALALDEAVASLSAALDLCPDDERAAPRRLRILELIAETHFWRDDPDAMRSAALAAADLARSSGSAEDLARTVVVAARWNRGGVLQSNILELLDEAEARLPSGDSPLRSQVISMRAYVLQGAGRGYDTRTIAADAEAMARRCDDADSLTMALLVRTYAEAGGPAVDRARGIVAELESAAARVSRRDHREQYTSFALRARAQVQLAAGDGIGFAATRRELGAVVDRMRASYVRGQILQWDAAIAIAEGEFARATDLTSQALATWDARPDAFRVHRLQMGGIALELGDHEAVVPALEEFVAGDASSGGFAWRAALATSLVTMGRRDDGRRRLEDLGAGGFRGLVADHQRPIALRWLAEGIALLGLAELAADLLPIVEPYAGTLFVGPAVSTVEGAADRALGQLLMVLGRHVDAGARLEAAAVLERELGFTALETRSRYWQAANLARCEEPTARARAAALAAQVADTAARLGMRPLEAGARELAG
jgi:hypothetical protein